MVRCSIGLDFGTTNSSVAVAKTGGSVELLRFSGSSSFRSLLYLEQERSSGRLITRSHTGPQAIARYLGRDTRAVEQPGRLIQSLKSFLSARAFSGTEVLGRHQTIEDLISLILKDLRQAASVHIGSSVTHATVGRPVRFVGANSSEDDALAVQRLSTALRLAGFESFDFVPEPIGAAYAYQANLESDELVLIADFGGGTSDFSLVRVGPNARTQGPSAQALGNVGVGLAGDALDAKLVRYLVAPSLGSEGTLPSFGKNLSAVPAWIYANLERWHHLSFLRTKNVEQILSAARLQAGRFAQGEELAAQLDALITLVQEDLGYSLHEAVQRTKTALSVNTATDFLFCQSGLFLARAVDRQQFEVWIAPELRAIEAAIDSLMSDTKITSAQIDRVFLTGGTSYVPAVRRIFESRFGGHLIVTGDAFTSVAQGLALYGLERSGNGRISSELTAGTKT